MVGHVRRGGSAKSTPGGSRNPPAWSDKLAQNYYLLSSLNQGDCGDFCGDSSFISTDSRTSQTMFVQVVNNLTKKGLQGFLSSVQQHNEMVRKGFLNRGSGVRISPGPFFNNLRVSTRGKSSGPRDRVSLPYRSRPRANQLIPGWLQSDFSIQSTKVHLRCIFRCMFATRMCGP